MFRPEEARQYLGDIRVSTWRRLVRDLNLKPALRIASIPLYTKAQLDEVIQKLIAAESAKAA